MTEGVLRVRREWEPEELVDCWTLVDDAWGLVAMNTIMVQRILANNEWSARLTDEDRRGLSPLFWTHVNLYGKFTLDMDRHLNLDLESVA